MTDQCSELWLPVAGYEGLYEVSDRGRVRSLDRVVTRRFPNGPSLEVHRRGKVLRPRKGSRHHYMVGLCRDGHDKTVSVHTLVLTAFSGPRPEGMEGCHGPGGPLDNRIENLRWDTHGNNMLDAVDRDNTHASASKIKCKRGHWLSGRNVVHYIAKYESRRGRGPGRKCVACERAHSTVRKALERKGVVLDMQIVSDEHYVKIMGIAA